MSSSILVLLLHCLLSKFLYKLNRYLEKDKENQAETQLWKWDFMEIRNNKKSLSENGRHCPESREDSFTFFM